MLEVIIYWYKKSINNNENENENDPLDIWNNSEIKGNGKPISLIDGQAWINNLNSKHPEFYHFIISQA
jgi:hypothetical protein